MSEAIAPVRMLGGDRSAVTSPSTYCSCLSESLQLSSSFHRHPPLQTPKRLTKQFSSGFLGSSQADPYCSYYHFFPPSPQQFNCYFASTSFFRRQSHHRSPLPQIEAQPPPPRHRDLELDITMAEFKLSAQLLGHEADVRHPSALFTLCLHIHVQVFPLLTLSSTAGPRR